MINKQKTPIFFLEELKSKAVTLGQSLGHVYLEIETTGQKPIVFLKINEKIKLRENYIEYIAQRKSHALRKIAKKQINKINNIDQFTKDLKELNTPIGEGNLGFSRQLTTFIKICFITSIHPDTLIYIIEHINQAIQEYRYKCKYESMGELLNYEPKSKIIIEKKLINQYPHTQSIISKVIQNKTKVSQK